jgi:hypothetical protein
VTSARGHVKGELRLLLSGAALVGAAGALLHTVSTPSTGEAAVVGKPLVESRLSALADTSRPSAVEVVGQAARAVLGGMGIESGVAVHRANRALEALQGHVPATSHPDALRLAFRAYFNYQAAHPNRVRKPYLYFVDFGLDSRTPRGYVFDMSSLTLVDGPFPVSHGSGSAEVNGVPTRFSNRKGSNATSLGLYLAQETYRFRGRSAGRQYTSIGLRLAGVSGRFNNAARTRGIVVHGAPYVTAARAGRSQGCPAMEQRRADRIIPRIANGGMVFHFSPLDRAWMAEDPWLRIGG